MKLDTDHNVGSASAKSTIFRVLMSYLDKVIQCGGTRGTFTFHDTADFGASPQWRFAGFSNEVMRVRKYNFLDTGI